MKKRGSFVVVAVVLAAAGVARAQGAAKPAGTPPPAAAPAAKPAPAPAPAVTAKPPLTAPTHAAAAGSPAAPTAGVAAPPAGGAPPAGAPPKPQPSKELEAVMKPFEGTWKCETKFPAGAFGPSSPEVAAKSTVKFKRDLDGFFYRGEYEVKKQKGFDMTMRGVFYIGWDPGSSQVIVTSVDNMGGLGSGAGKIEGTGMSYSGEAYVMGMKVKTRESMGTKGPKEGFHKMEMDMGKGFMPFGEDSCKK